MAKHSNIYNSLSKSGEALQYYRITIFSTIILYVYSTINFINCQLLFVLHLYFTFLLLFLPFRLWQLLIHRNEQPLQKLFIIHLVYQQHFLCSLIRCFIYWIRHMGNCRLSGLYKQSIIIFLSTLPVGGATANMIIFHSYLQQFIMQSDNFFWNQQFKSNFMRVFAKFLNRYIYFSKSSSASLLRNLCLLPFRTGTNKKVFWWYYLHLNKMV